ncbi:MAG: DUF5710 domain-containing protein [Oscillospiraceae bacterium]|nr:DUF5710 domain-containing protein [Oscillospiraceae bacterium]
MALLLNIPYSEKDEAKKLGAKWNPKLKKWYVQDKKDYYKFSKWILGNEDSATIICDHIYIVEGIRQCFRCKQPTKVIGFGIENMFEIAKPEEYTNVYSPCQYYTDEIHIAPFLSNFTPEFLDFLDRNWGYRKDYSKIAGVDYYNHCSCCGVLQGNFYLFDEDDSPFFPTTENEAKKLTLHKIIIENDFIFSGPIIFSTTDPFIKLHSSICELNYNFGM